MTLRMLGIFALPGVIASLFAAPAFAATEGVRAPAEVILPAERPRVSSGPFRRPFTHSHFGEYYFSPFGYWNHPALPLGWHPLFHEPGKTSWWVAAGSNDYLGAGFHTSMLDPESRIRVDFQASWESGETWWDADYERFHLAPTLAWHSKNTTVWVGFDHGENTYEPNPVTPRARPALAGHSTFSAVETDRDWGRSEDRYSWDTAHAGIHHRINDVLDVSATVSHSRIRD